MRDGQPQKVPPTEAELKGAKDAILNSFIFRVDTKRKVMIETREQRVLRTAGRPARSVVPAIQKVTVADVNRAIEKYIHRDKVAILVVGKSQDFDRPLSSFGAVTPIDITIPQTKAAAPAPGGAPAAAAAPAPSSPEAKALFAKVIESLGGAARVMEVKSYREKATWSEGAQRADDRSGVWSWVNAPTASVS
jgi:hypothetical protein